MIDYKITKDRILMAEVVEYSLFNGLELIRKPLSEEETLRKVAFINGHIIDFLTGSEIFELKRDYSGFIECDVEANTLYYLELYKCNNVTDKDLMYAAKLYEEFAYKQELIKEHKLIPFPNKTLYQHKRR